MANSSKRDIRKAEMAERRRKALELRKAGANYDQIATQLGYGNKGNAWRDVQFAIRDWYREPAQDVLAIELQRLDVMLLGLWSKAKAGNVQAVDRVLRIQERRSAYEGLDAPKLLKIELDRALTDFLERVKAAFPADVYEQILSVAAGEPRPEAPPADPDEPG